MKTYPLGSGSMPAIGLGTWKMDDGAATPAVETAIRLGYRHIDCAPIYLNEPDIGEVFGKTFASGGLDRSEFWITSKLWCNRHHPDNVKSAIKQTLTDLRLDYLDLFMIHWPIVFRPDVHRPSGPGDFLTLAEVPLIETWQAMEECVDAGLCRNLGVCNFNRKNLQQILDGCRLQPAVNQVECHPFLNQRQLFDFCNENKVQPVAYSPLGSGDRPEKMKDPNDPSLFQNETLRELASKNGISIGQLALAWAVNRGTVAIPKSTNEKRLAENLAAAEIELSAEDMSAIENLGQHHRFVHGRFWESLGGPYTVADLWGESI